MLRQASRRKYHYIYKTTCKVTGKYYIGMHSTDDLNDGYVGSGKRLGYSIRKHGRENHVCEVLEFYFTREWLREREAELVCAETLTDPLCMNLKLGGEGGFDHIHKAGNKNVYVLNSNVEHQKKACDGLNAYIKDQLQTNSEFKEKFLVKQNKNLKRARVVIKEKHGVNSMFSILNSSPEFQEKRKAKFEEIGHQKGASNSQFGTCWVYSETKNTAMKIAKVELSNYLNSGWVAGRGKKK